MKNTFGNLYGRCLLVACWCFATLLLSACGGGGSGSNNGNGSSGSSSSSSGSTSSSSSGVAMRSPDWVVFRADKEVDERFDIYATLDDGSIDPVMLSSMDTPVSCFSFYVSPDGEHVAFLAYADTNTDGIFDFNDGPAELYRVPVDGSSAPIKISGTINSYTGIDRISWSPASTMLSFRADIDTDNVREIYLVRNEETEPTKINGNTAGIVEMGDTHWSPDGRYLAQFVLNRDRRYIMDRQGINVHDTTLGTFNSTRMTGDLLPGSDYDSINGWSGANISHLYWAPDSSRIVYMLDDHRTGDQRRYYQAFPDGTFENVTGPLAANENGGLTYSWSPDSRYLAYEVVTTGVGANIIEIYDSVEMDHHRLFTAPNGGRIGYDLYWRPGMNEFAILMSSAASDVPYDLYIFGVNDPYTATPTPTIAIGSNSGSLNELSWSADGARLVFRAYNSVDNISALAGFVPGEPISLTQISPNVTGSSQALGYSWFPSPDMILFHTTDAHYVTPVDTANAYDNISGSLDVNVPLNFGLDGYMGKVTTLETSATPNRVGFLAVVSETGATGLYTVLPDGSELTEIAGAMVVGGNVVDMQFAKPAE